MSEAEASPMPAVGGSRPVGFDLERPPIFRREQVLLRIAVLAVIGWIAHPLGLLWVVLPVVAAIVVSRKGGRRYLDEDGPTVTGVLHWLLDLTAYIGLLTDRLPWPGEYAVRFEVERSGAPTTSSALRRMLYVIPNVIVFSFLTFVGSIVWVIALVCVLVGESYPAGLWRFMRGLLRWEACLLAYLASLTDRYPSFWLETGT